MQQKRHFSKFTDCKIPTTMTSQSFSHQFTTANFSRAKRIKVWANGDKRCYEFTINPKDFRTWNSVLLHVTETITPRFGAIRKLVSLRTKQEVISIEDLIQGDKYVGFGAGSQTFLRPQEYRTTQELEAFRKRKTAKRLYVGPLHFGDKEFLNEMAKKKLTVVFATLNGVNTEPAQKVVFSQNDLHNWELIINYLSKIFSIPEGIGHICTIDGIGLKDAKEFQHGYLYVVVPNNNVFKPIDYIRLFAEPNGTQTRRRLSRNIRKQSTEKNQQDATKKINNVD